MPRVRPESAGWSGSPTWPAAAADLVHRMPRDRARRAHRTPDAGVVAVPPARTGAAGDRDGVVLVETQARLMQRPVRDTLAFALVFKLVTLFASPPRVTYFGNGPLQPAYALGRIIPPSPGRMVASDPFTSYYIPARHRPRRADDDEGARRLAGGAGRSDPRYAYCTASTSRPTPTGGRAARRPAGAPDVRFVLVEKRTSLVAARPRACSRTARRRWCARRQTSTCSDGCTGG